MKEREGVLPKAPLIYALSVLRFSPVLVMSKLIPAIQQAIRESLPEFFQMVKNAPGAPQSSEPNSWAFMDKYLKNACVLSQDYLIFQSIDYLHFDSHAELFNKCVEAVVHETGGLDVAGLGMRYVDMVEPGRGEHLSDYLPHALLPLENDAIASLGSGEPKKPLGVSTTTYHFDPEFLHIRCWRQPGMWVPDDLIEPAMVFEIARQTHHQGHGAGRQIQSPPVYTPLSESGALLDTDAYWPLALTERLPPEEISLRLKHLHTIANNAFRNVATEHAFQRWNEKS
ncbi:TIGR04255 family protein [Pseudomonas kulmbachensis]|mgnify:CR=1 FL=1|uniref:TIGR04255 family protein n=1 Tax=Pseudomonas kulmbachensis TaxID=3043408 RepID=A0ABW7M428_9PSED